MAVNENEESYLLQTNLQYMNRESQTNLIESKFEH